jgi:hypothetical protein
MSLQKLRDVILPSLVVSGVILLNHQSAQALTWTFTNVRSATGCLFNGSTFNYSSSGGFSTITVKTMGFPPGCTGKSVDYNTDLGSTSTTLFFSNGADLEGDRFIYVDLATALPDTGGAVQFKIYTFNNTGPNFNCISHDDTGLCSSDSFSQGLLTAPSVPFNPSPALGWVLGALQDWGGIW